MPPAHRTAAAQRTSTIALVPEFIPLRLPSVTPEPVVAELKIELRKGPLSMSITWPMHTAADFAPFAQRAAAVLKYLHRVSGQLNQLETAA